MRGFFWISAALAALLCLAGCEAAAPSGGKPQAEQPVVSSSSPSSPQGESSRRTRFLEAYTAALRQVQEGKNPASPAPRDPSETGFAVVPLDRDRYGVDAYAFLPLRERTLTEEEFLQLAQAMGGLSGEELLTPEHARTGLLQEEGDELQRQNRALGKEERRQLLLLEPEYLYAQLRGEASSGSGVLAVNLTADQTERFAILPRGELTEEELLEYLDVKYAGISLEEKLQPLEGQLSYQELPEMLREANAKYHFFDGELPEYSAMLAQHNSGGTERVPEEETWNVTFLNQTGDQFTAGFWAEDGALSGWVRYPPGYFTEPEFTAPEPDGSGKSGGEPEKIAADYALSLLEDAEFASAEREGEYQNPYYGAADWVAVKMKDGRKVTLAVQRSGGLILNVSILSKRA